LPEAATLPPLREAYEFYGAARAVPNYVNGFAVQSLAYTAPFDAVGTAPAINAADTRGAFRNASRHRWRAGSSPACARRTAISG
jgi:hypothetical protein